MSDVMTGKLKRDVLHVDFYDMSTFLSHLSSTVASASNIEGLHGLENDNDVVRKEGGGTRFLDLAACSLISC